MSKSTFKILFYVRKNQINKDGTVSIMVRITLNGELCQFSSKLCIQPQFWDAKQGKAIGNSLKSRQLNSTLDEIRRSLLNHYHNMMIRETYVTAEKLRNAFLGFDAREHTLINLFRKYIEDAKKLVGISKSKATVEKYDRCCRRLENFLSNIYNIGDIAVKDINHMFITDFENYLRTSCKCGENTTAKFIQTFKTVVILAKNNGWIYSDPFANYKIRIKRVDRGYLTE